MNMTVIGKKTFVNRPSISLRFRPVPRPLLCHEKDAPAVPALPEAPLFRFSGQERTASRAGEEGIRGHGRSLSPGEEKEIRCTG
jgi:hypothetical protein